MHRESDSAPGAEPIGPPRRLSGMRRLIAVSIVSIVAGQVAGCASQTDDQVTASGGPATGIVQSRTATLTIATSLSTDGPMYIEGALARLVLRDEDGDVVASAMKWPGKKFVFADLEPGTYVLEPALRPCDGNCDYLDPPTDSCRDTFAIDGDLSLQVDFSVGDRCVVGNALRG